MEPEPCTEQGEGVAALAGEGGLLRFCPAVPEWKPEEEGNSEEFMKK